MKARPLLVAWFVASAVALSLAQQTIVVSLTTGSIRGAVRDVQAATGPALVAVVFPIDSSKWTGPGGAAMIKRADVVSGRFAFDELPVGDYRLALATAADLTGWPAAAVLERLAAQKTLALPIAAGEQVGVDAVAIRLLDGVAIQDAAVSRIRFVSSGARTLFEPPVIPGSISGRVTDAEGKPVPGVEVRALAWTLGGGVTRNSIGPFVVTDADGRYVVPSQQPGAYLISVPSFTPDRQSPLGASVRRVPRASLGDDGNRRGYVNTYFPNAVDANAAKVVYVTTSERSGVDIQLSSRAVFDVAGRILGDLPIQVVPPVMTVTYLRGDSRTAFGDPRRVILSPDWTFAIDELPDGEYALDMIVGTGFVQDRLLVAGKAPPRVALVLHSFTLATGRAEFYGQSQPAATSRGMVYLSPVTPRDDGVYTSMVQADGTFSAQGIGPGPYRLRGSAPAPWVQVSGMINGLDTLDLPASLGKNVANAVVVFADRESRIVIDARNVRGEPAGEAGVLVFSDDQRYWISSSRRVQLSETTADGKCLLTDLPPGKYFAVAGRDFRMGRAITPTFVGALKSRAVAFEMGVGENKVVSVVVK